MGGNSKSTGTARFLCWIEESRFGLVHPREAAYPPRRRCCFAGSCGNQVAAGVYPRQEDDTVFLTRREFQQELAQCRQRCGAGWGRRLPGALFEDCPRAAQIREEMARTASGAARAVLSGGDVRQELTRMKERGMALREEYNGLLAQNG